MICCLLVYIPALIRMQLMENIYMPETFNAYNNSEKILNLQELNSFEGNIESFTINAEEAAQILGVNRSRLSQLTSKGALPFERRKIETRNRLFYKLSDLLNHQRSQIQTNQLINPYLAGKTFKQDIQELDIQPKHSSIDDEEKRNLKEIFTKHFNTKKRPFKNKNITLAKDLYFNEKINCENIEDKESIFFIKEKIIQQEEVIKNIKHDNIKKENNILACIKENNNSISNVQYAIILLNKEIKKLSEISEILTIKSKMKSINDMRIKSLWKKKKAKYASKLTAGS